MLYFQLKMGNDTSYTIVKFLALDNLVDID